MFRDPARDPGLVSIDSIADESSVPAISPPTIAPALERLAAIRRSLGA